MIDQNTSAELFYRCSKLDLGSFLELIHRFFESDVRMIARVEFNLEFVGICHVFDLTFKIKGFTFVGLFMAVLL